MAFFSCVANLLLTTIPLHLLRLKESSLGSVIFISGLGLILGMRHSTDADHIVALSTIVTKQRAIHRAAVIGALWGVGHTITILIVGSLLILFNVRIPTRLGLAMEFCVAVMLVVLGLLNLTGLMERISTYFLARGEQALPSTVVVTKGKWSSFKESIDQMGVYHWLRPLVIGLVHGLAGSAAVALLVLSTIRSPLWATVYLLIFGVGTVIGMMLMTTAMVLPLSYGSKHFAKLNSYLAILSGVVSLCFGSFLMYQLGFVGGLFNRHPHWTPQ